MKCDVAFIRWTLGNLVVCDIKIQVIVGNLAVCDIKGQCHSGKRLIVCGIHEHCHSGKLLISVCHRNSVIVRKLVECDIKGQCHSEFPVWRHCISSVLKIVFMNLVKYHLLDITTKGLWYCSIAYKLVFCSLHVVWKMGLRYKKIGNSRARTWKTSYYKVYDRVLEFFCELK